MVTLVTTNDGGGAQLKLTRAKANYAGGGMPLNLVQGINDRRNHRGKINKEQQQQELWVC